MLVTQFELSWKESRVLWELRCNLDDVGRCALSRTSTLSAMLQLRRRCAVNMLDAVNAGRSRALRESRRAGAVLVVRADDAGVGGFGVAVAAGLVCRKRRDLSGRLEAGWGG